jgi:hypothetical protein
MNVQISHTHTQEEAKRRIESLIQNLKVQFGDQISDLKEQWADYTGKIEGSAKGYSLSGSIEISPDAVTVDLKIPFILRVFSKKIRAVMEERLERSLS